MSRRIKNLNDLNEIFSTVDKIKSSRSPVQSLSRRVYIVSYNGEDGIDCSSVLDSIPDSDAIMFQGLYGSSLWKHVGDFEQSLAARSQYVTYDFYNIFKSLTKNIVINNSSVFSSVIPAIQNLGESLIKSSYGLGTAIYVSPHYGKGSRSWFVKNTPTRIRTCFFVLDNVDYMKINHRKNPQYFELEKSYENYLKDNLSGIVLPEFSEGFDNIVIVLNVSQGPILVDGGVVTVDSVKKFYSGSLVEHITK